MRRPQRHRLAAIVLVSCLATGAAACSSSSDTTGSSGSPGTAATGASGSDSSAADTSAAPTGTFPTATSKDLQAAADTVLAKSKVPGAVIVAWKDDKTWT